MKGGSPPTVTSTPLSRPAKAPVATATGMPIHIGPPMLIMMVAMPTIDSDITVPTDRSMPPLMITKVTPIARMARVVACRPMVSRLLVVMKSG